MTNERYILIYFFSILAIIFFLSIFDADSSELKLPASVVAIELPDGTYGILKADSIDLTGGIITSTTSSLYQLNVEIINATGTSSISDADVDTLRSDNSLIYTLNVEIANVTGTATIDKALIADAVADLLNGRILNVTETAKMFESTSGVAGAETLLVTGTATLDNAIIGAASAETFSATGDYTYNYSQTNVSLANVNSIRIREAGFQRYGGGQSWTTETLGDADRGADASFPPVAIFIGSDSDALIYDLDGTEWMEFDANVSGTDAFHNVGISALDWLNGILAAGFPTLNMRMVNFTNDRLILGSLYYEYKGAISERNEARGFNLISSSLSLVGIGANDVYLFRDSEGNINFAYASDNGLSISRDWGTDRAKIWDLTDATRPSFGDVCISINGYVYSTWVEVTNQWAYIVRHPILSSDVAGGSNFEYVYNSSTTDWGATDVSVPLDRRLLDLEIIDNASIFDGNNVIVASGNSFEFGGGLELIEEADDPTESYFQGINTDYYNRACGDNVLSLDFDDDTSSVATSHDVVGATVVLTGTPTFPDGIINSAIEFDGTTQYGTIYDSDDFSFGDGFSIGGWFYFDGITGQYLVSKANYDTTNAEYILQEASGRVVFSIYDGNTSNYIGRRTDPILSASQWYQIVVVYEGGTVSTNCKIYVNGEQYTTIDFSSGSFSAMDNTTENLMLAARKNTTIDNYFNGKMDQVFITQQELSAEVIKKLYQRDKAIYNSGNSALLAGTSDNVNDTAISENGKLLIVATDDALAIHDAQTLALVKTINTGANYSLVDVYGNPFYDAPGSGAVIIAYNSTAGNLEIYRDDITLQSVMAEAQAREITKDKITTDDLTAQRAYIPQINSATGEELFDIQPDGTTIHPYTIFTNGYGSPSDTDVKPGWVITTDDDDSSLLNLRNVVTGKHFAVPTELMTREYSPYIEQSTYTIRASNLPNVTPTITITEIQDAMGSNDESEPLFSNKFRVIGATTALTINRAWIDNTIMYISGDRYDMVRTATQQKEHIIKEYIKRRQPPRVNSIDASSLPPALTTQVSLGGQDYTMVNDALLLRENIVQDKRQQQMIDTLKKITVEMAKTLIQKGAMTIDDLNLTDKEKQWLQN